MKTVIFLLVSLLTLGLGSGAWYAYSGTTRPTTFRKATVERGDLFATITATGTVEPEEVIDVGAQVAGRIVTFGRDPRDSSKPIDYGSPVEEGTVLAQLDDALYGADVAQAEAQLGQAKANGERAKADLLQTQAKFRQAEREWSRARRLGPTSAIAQTDYDTAQANYETTQSAIAVAESAVHQADKTEAAAAANLKKTQTNLSYTVIKSPVRGVIVDRRVNVGQTVVASLNAPSLFLIAKDLKRLQVWASVNEADIGKIYPGQSVRFTVDAHPGEEFQGLVGQVRLNASMTQNVVTYTVVVNADNSKNKLLPYLTANLQFEVSRHTDVLRVPNAALRWKPQQAQIDSKFRAAQSGKGQGRRDKSSERDGQRGTLWVETTDGFVQPLTVKVGLSDGSMTEVSGEGIDEGIQVVVGVDHRDANSGGTTNPFAPQMSGAKK